MREFIGLVGGGFKPFTKGHYNLVETALQNNDKIILMIGRGDRERSGQHSILWANMEQVWKDYLEPAMPSNVEVRYVTSPIRETFEILEEASNDPENQNTYTIYGDPVDTARYYSSEKLKKYAERLVKNEQIIIKQVDRSETQGISGTKMRDWLAKGDMNSFIDGLPFIVQSHGPEIFKLLTDTTK